MSRCVALKECLEAFGVAVRLFVRGESLESLGGESFESFEWLRAWESGNVAALEANLAELIFLDSYFAPCDFCDFLAARAKKCVFFDDFNRIAYPKNGVILNGALDSQKLYNGVECEVFAGIEFAFLRGIFRKKEEKIVRENIEKILLFLNAPNAEKLAKNLQKIIRAALPNAQIIELINAKIPPSALKSLMRACDIAISSGGVSVVELLSTQTPTIALKIAANQAPQLKAWEKRGLLVAWEPRELGVIAGFLEALAPQDSRTKIAANLAEIPIGSGVGGFLEGLLK